MMSLQLRSMHLFDSGAKVSGAGTVSLSDGKNTVKIKVTAPSGEVKDLYNYHYEK